MIVALTEDIAADKIPTIKIPIKPCGKYFIIKGNKIRFDSVFKNSQGNVVSVTAAISFMKSGVKFTNAQ
jgi:hypothetical protein